MPIAKSNQPRKKRSFGPGRSAVVAKSTSRGKQLYNLWYHYSQKMKQDVVLRSDAEFRHFLWLEGDIDVASYELEPEPFIVGVGVDVHKTQFDALVRRRNGPPQLREIKSGDVTAGTGSVRDQHQQEAQEVAAEHAGFQYVRIGDAELQANYQLICNWLRAVPFLAAARNLPLDSYRNEIALALQREHGATTIERLLAGTDHSYEPLYLAAIFDRIQFCPLQSDLDSRPLSYQTRIWLLEEAK